MKISEHITLDEATKSNTALRLGIVNVPNAEQLDAMVLVALTCFEPIRTWFGQPIKVNSFFRCPELNKAVGGSTTSQHCKGEAVDMDGGSKESNKAIFDWAKANLKFDQLINEYDYSWVHISFSKNGNRNQTLVIK